MKVSLREVIESDLAVFYEHQKDPVAARSAAFRPRDKPLFMSHWRETVLPDVTVIKRTVVCDGEIVGNVISFNRDGRREVGYWIGRAHWGKGIATEALRQLLRVVAERPLYAIVACSNAASIRVLEKCGFVVEDKIRGSAGGRGPAVDEFVMKLVGAAPSGREKQ